MAAMMCGGRSAFFSEPYASGYCAIVADQVDGLKYVGVKQAGKNGLTLIKILGRIPNKRLK